MPGRLSLVSPWVVALVAGLAGFGSPAASMPAAPEARGASNAPLERPNDPPGRPARALPGASPASVIRFGRFTSIQVNVDAGGADIPGDAANEPSLAVDPTSHDRMAIGWRQFDTVASDFREAGYGFSTNGGQTWATGVLDSGAFRSDPVLDVDAEGRFYYHSLRVPVDDPPVLNTDVFRSSDGGATWGLPTLAYGGDKPWMTIDRTGGPGHGHIYQAWNLDPNLIRPTFNRSVDGGMTFEPPLDTYTPRFATLAVAPDGTLYIAGVYGDDLLTVFRSLNARDPMATPTFSSSGTDLGGYIVTADGPNPVGLLGQVWIAVDPSTGPTAGYVYVLATVSTDPVLGTPTDVHFLRSTDQGQTWSDPIRVNDDPSGNGAWQWFGTMSVSPGGRIDAVWNDTRNSGSTMVSELFYSSSTDGGLTWSPNEQASPAWDSSVGWPNQAKIGDYYHMVSDETGADLAYAATFNGGQDIYYMRIEPPATAVSGSPTARYRLHAGWPNPFQSSTTVRFEAPFEAGRVKLDVFDVSGRPVRTLVDGIARGGSQTVRWDARDSAGRRVKPGVYFCHLQAPGFSDIQKLVVFH